MSARKDIVALCGGRAAIVPAEACDDDSLSDGAFRLFAVLCGRANRKDEAELVVKAYASHRGVTPRAVQKWKAELEVTGRLVQLHTGDKAKGLYRVVRNPAERAQAMIENARKLAARRKAKTTRRARPTAPANCGSHPRCELMFAQENTSKITLNPPHAPPGASPPLSGAVEALGNGNQKTTSARQRGAADRHDERQGHLMWPPHELAGSRAERSECIDWKAWEHWLLRNHIGDNPIGYLAVQGERIGLALDLPGEAADKILDAALRLSRRTGVHPTGAINRAIKKRSKAA